MSPTSIAGKTTKTKLAFDSDASGNSIRWCSGASCTVNHGPWPAGAYSIYITGTHTRDDDDRFMALPCREAVSAGTRAGDGRTVCARTCVRASRISFCGNPNAHTKKRNYLLSNASAIGETHWCLNASTCVHAVTHMCQLDYDVCGNWRRV